MDYHQADRASTALAGIVESIADLIEDQLRLPAPVEHLRRRAGEIRTDRFTVLVVGEFKRGKSTLLNAMMGGRVLPQKVAPCTAVVTIIGYGEAKRVRIHFAVTTGQEPPPDQHLSIEEFQRRYALQAADAGDDEGLDCGFDRFSAIDHARVEYPVEICRHRVELVDSPGLGEHRIRTERTQAYLDRADAVVMVLDATQLLRDEELHFLENVLLPRGLKNIFFAINKWNLIADQVLIPDEAEASYQELDIRLREKLGSFCVIDGVDRSAERIFRVDALGALKARIDGQTDAASLESTGMPAFEGALQRFLVEERGRARRDLIMAQLRNTLDGVQRHIESQIALATRSIAEIEQERIDIAPKLQRLRDIKRDTDDFLREKSDALQDRLVISFKQKVEGIDRDIPNAVARFGLDDLTKGSLWKLLTDWARADEKKFERVLERHLRPQVERYFEQRLAEWQVVVNRYEMEDVAGAIEERLSRYAEQYLRVLAEIEAKIGVEHSALPEIKVLVANWLGANERMLGGQQGGIVASARLAIVGDLIPVLAGVAADLASQFVGVALPIIGVIVTGWRLYAREQNMQREMAEKIVAGMRTQLRQVENTQAAVIRDRVAEGFARLRAAMVDSIERDIFGVEDALQDIIDRKQAREYSAIEDQARMRAARLLIAEDIQALECADLARLEAIVEQRKIERRNQPIKPSGPERSLTKIDRGPTPALGGPAQIASIADFSAGFADMIDALSRGHQELDALVVGRPRSIARVAETIDRLKEQQSRGLRVAVFGGFSSGKSSLINALLGIDHLVVGTQATTASITHIRRSADGTETAQVHFKGLATFCAEIWEQIKHYHAGLMEAPDQMPADLVDSFDQISAQFADPSGAVPLASVSWLSGILLPTLSAYVEAAARSGRVPPAERRADSGMTAQYLGLVSRLGQDMLERLGTVDQLPLTELEPVLSREETAVCVDRVELRLNATLLEGDLEIVDTPGLGSLHARHTRRSESFVKDVDALLYVLPERGVGKDDAEFLALLERRNEVLKEDKVFFVANMVDKCIAEDAKDEQTTDPVAREIDAHAERIASELSRYLPSPRVFAVAAETARLARTALAGQLSLRDRRLFQKVALWYGPGESPDPASNLALSGVPGLNDTLKTYLVDRGVRIRVDQARGRIGAVLGQVETEGTERLRLMSLEQEDLESMRQKLHETKRRISGAKASKRERARNAVVGLIETNGRKMREEIAGILDDIVEPLTDEWMRKRASSFSVYEKAAAHYWSKFRDLISGEQTKSSLETLIGEMVEHVLSRTMARRQSKEQLERMQSELISEASASIAASLTEISDELNRVRSGDRTDGPTRALAPAATDSYGAVLVSDVVQRVKDIVLTITVGTVGIIALDVFLTLGLATIVTAILAVLFNFAKNKDAEREKVRAKIREKLMSKKLEILQNAVDEKLAVIEQDLLSYYDEQVNILISKLEEEIDQAEIDIQTNSEARDTLATDHQRLGEIVQSLRQRLDLALPEMA